MRKTFPDINETLLSLNCDVLQKIQETLPRHDILIQRLEPLLESKIENIELQQAEQEKRLQLIIEQSLRRFQTKMEPLLQERESLLAVLCQTHSENLSLLEAMIQQSVDDEIINRTKMTIAWLARFLESKKIELITGAEGHPFDTTAMQAQGNECRGDIPNGIVIKEISPGYRLKKGKSYRYLNRAQVVININQ